VRVAARHLLALLVSASAAAADPLSVDPGLKPGAPVDPHRPPAQELVTSASPTLAVAAVGSLVLDGPDAPLPPLDPAVRAILRGVDRPGGQTVGIGALQTTIIDLKAMKAFPYPWNDAPVPRVSPGAAAALREDGFGALLLAGPHALDWGIEGMRATGAALDAAGIARAGTGNTAGIARHAQYYDDPAGGGRVAIVSAAATFRPTSDALDQNGAAPGRPGVAGLEVVPVRLVSPEQRDTVQAVACRFSYPGVPGACSHLTPAAEVATLGSTFRVGDAPPLYGTTTYQLNDRAADALLRDIREGKQSADLLVTGIYSAEVEDARVADPPPPAFLVSLAHAAVESGADMVVGTGRPVLGPIEIYAPPHGRPRPIFYGLGDFAWSPSVAPSEHPIDSAIVRSVVDGAAVAVEIFPLDLAAHNGWPILADRGRATAILQHLQAISRPYGTTIAIVPSGDTVLGRIAVGDRSGGPK